jgi:hypothetical protein
MEPPGRATLLPSLIVAPRWTSSRNRLSVSAVDCAGAGEVRASRLPGHFVGPSSKTRRFPQVNTEGTFAGSFELNTECRSLHPRHPTHCPGGRGIGFHQGQAVFAPWPSLGIIWKFYVGQTAKDTLKSWSRLSILLLLSGFLLPVPTLDPAAAATSSRCQARSSLPRNRTC